MGDFIDIDRKKDHDSNMIKNLFHSLTSILSPKKVYYFFIRFE